MLALRWAIVALWLLGYYIVLIFNSYFMLLEILVFYDLFYIVFSVIDGKENLTLDKIQRIKAARLVEFCLPTLLTIIISKLKWKQNIVLKNFPDIDKTMKE